MIIFVVAALLRTAAVATEAPAPHSLITADAAPSFRFDGIGGLSGGGATSTFLLSYEQEARNEILDWMFKPHYAASLGILKVEIGADDQTTDGTEASHMRTPTEVNCSRGYEWALMKEAVKRNPNIVLYGLPWGFAGWLGYGTQNPYHNVTATADYIATWVECGRDVHGLNISVLGLWNEAWQAAGRPDTDPWEYALALRQRLDSSGLGHVRILAPDGDIADIVTSLQRNASYRAVTSLLGQHYPGARGTTATERGFGMPLWSSEDYSTYSDATGAGCWARLLVQNAGWGYSATISWYLLGSFARGMNYDSDGLLRAEWPSSGHWEVTPMAWMTMHWTLFTEPGWGILSCPRYNSSVTNCALAGGGNYAVVSFGTDVTVVIETFERNASQCIRNDPHREWSVAGSQTASIALPRRVTAAIMDGGSMRMDVWRSCTSWRYPANDDTYMEKLPSLAVVDGKVTLADVKRNCVYTVTTVVGRAKPKLPDAGAGSDPRPASFPLPYHESFDGRTVGGEAPYFGDQEGKWETVPAGGGRAGMVSQQQLPLAPWPILEPQCNSHGQPISIIGDLFFENTRVSADVLLPEPGVGAGLALRIRPPSGGSTMAGRNFRGNVPGLFLYLGDTPAVLKSDPNLQNPGGVAPGPNVDGPGWSLCQDSYCIVKLVDGSLPVHAGPLVGTWHAISLEVTDGHATGLIDNATIFAGVPISGTTESGLRADSCLANMSGVSCPGLEPDPTGDASAELCAATCCKDPTCKVWQWNPKSATSVKAGVCWRGTCMGKQNSKPGWVGGTRGLAPAPTPAPPKPAFAGVPPSGWAGLVATLGRSQVDNFELHGTSARGAAATPCGDAPPASGSSLVSTPCDFPGALTSWSLQEGQLRLVSGASGGKFCLGTAPGSTSNVSLVSCGSATALRFVEATGQIKGPVDSSSCLRAVQRRQHDIRHSALTMGACAPAPSDSQQFQFNPATGALRQKGRQCIAEWPSDLIDYRDCCIALCQLSEHGGPEARPEVRIEI